MPETRSRANIDCFPGESVEVDCVIRSILWFGTCQVSVNRSSGLTQWRSYSLAFVSVVRALYNQSPSKSMQWSALPEPEFVNATCANLNTNSEVGECISRWRQLPTVELPKELRCPRRHREVRFET